MLRLGEEEVKDYILCDDRFRIWPYDIKIIDEIKQINIDKGLAKHNSKFYNLNPKVTVRLINKVRVE